MEYDTIPDMCFHSSKYLNANNYTLLAEIKSGTSLSDLKKAFVQLITYAMALYVSEEEEVIQKGNKLFVLLIVMPDDLLVGLFNPLQMRRLVFQSFKVFRPLLRVHRKDAVDCDFDFRCFLSFLAQLDSFIFQAKSEN